MAYMYTTQGELVSISKPTRPITTIESFIGARSAVPTSESAKDHDAQNEISYIRAGKCKYTNCFDCTYDESSLGGLMKCTCITSETEQAALGAGLNECISKNKDIKLSQDMRFNCDN
jgi:hypothetical protein